jgi:ATP-binding cassette subfamily B protein/ATP-binding cassette subfamily C protein
METVLKRPMWPLLWRLIWYQPNLFLLDTLLWIVNMGLQPVPGVITREFFDTLTGNAQLGWSPWALLALMGGISLGELTVLFAAQFTKSQLRFTLSSLMRRNLLAHLLAQPGARPLAEVGAPDKTISTGEAMSYFRDDVRQVEDSIAMISVILGLGLTTIASIALMLSVSVYMTLLVLLPLVGIVIVVQQMESRIKRYRRASRQATERVTGVIGEIFNSVQAIKVAGAQSHILRHFRQVNEQRRQMMLQDQLFTAILGSVFQNMISLGTGLILLVAALFVQTGTRTLTVGEFALFAYYLTYVTSTMSFFGRTFAMYKQTGVSMERLAVLLHGEPAERLAAPQPLYLKGLLGRTPELPSVNQLQRGQEGNLNKLTVANLTYHYPDTGRGITDISLNLEGGSFSVITGRVGSGKTTLLRTLLGLLPRQQGQIYWNGDLVSDPATFFIPPRAPTLPRRRDCLATPLRKISCSAWSGLKPTSSRRFAWLFLNRTWPRCPQA